MRLKNVLKKLTELEFTAVSQNNTGWNGSGKGSVDTLEEGSTVILREKGFWMNDNARKIGFTNTYRWTFKDSQNVSLEHLRFGADQPVYLFDLKKKSADLWDSKCPHVCKLDLYEAELKLEDDLLLLNWTVKGPEKDETISYIYR